MASFVRPMLIEDIPQVSGIEREAFPPPWPPTNFKRDLTVNTLTRYLVACEEPGLTSGGEIDHESVSACDKGETSWIDSIKEAIACLLGRKNKDEKPRQFIFGFAGLWFMADEAHLANIAVREAYRNKGIGECLLISVIELAITQNARFITLEVRESNEAARALYQKYGFVESGVRKGYYTDNKEDAIIMTVDGISTDDFKGKFLELRKGNEQRLAGLSVCEK